MSVLGLNEIHKRIKRSKLIENLGSRDLKNPEGVGIDLRLGSVYKITKGGAFIEADGEVQLGKRKGVETKVIAEYAEGKVQKEIVIKPGEYYLVQTVESLNTPSDLMPIVHVRTSLFRAGLLLLNSKTDPGYCGKLTMGLTNLSPFPVKLQIGARVCNIIFHKIEGKTVAYRGQHQGGRVSPKKEERQV
ncbi:dCTP deaminase [Candidatus Daviesbacteria bacterium]|nr:dCTP deaminase [Candidatus Daviesbacteria bacterium]